MLGLNLNTNVPFSPTSGVTYQAPNIEEEVDAVTGMMDGHIYSVLDFFKYILYAYIQQQQKVRCGIISW